VAAAAASLHQAGEPLPAWFSLLDPSRRNHSDRPMDDHLTIDTPEMVPLELAIAGVGSRFLALALDTLIQVAVVAVATILLAVLFRAHPARPAPFSTWVAAAVVLFYFLVVFVYFAFFEAVWNGQTPGKRFMHLRVVKHSGHPIHAMDSIARNLLRIVDSMPGIYAVGVICALLNRQSGTVVVREAVPEWERSLHGIYAKDDVTPFRGSSISLARVTPEDLKLIETFLIRRDQLSASVRREIAGQILDRLASKVNLSDRVDIPPETLIENVAAEYRNQSRLNSNCALDRNE
jgi:uncharacterized RDD family membrane protein YckC